MGTSPRIKIDATRAAAERGHIIELSRCDDQVCAKIPNIGQAVVDGCTTMVLLYGQCAGIVSPLTADVSDGDKALTGNLAFCDNSGDAVLVPDHNFVLSRGYETVRVLAVADDNAWTDRSNLLMWRGWVTGRAAIAAPEMDWRDQNILPRTRMCLRLKDVPQTDAKLTGPVDPAVSEFLTRYELMGMYVANLSWFGMKFALDIDGNTNAWSGLFTKLLMGCCVIKVTSAEGYRQWYYGALEPWVHFVPVRSDMTDLVEKIEWCRAHLSEAESIARAGRVLALELTFESQVRRAVRDITAIASTR